MGFISLIAPLYLPCYIGHYLNMAGELLRNQELLSNKTVDSV